MRSLLVSALLLVAVIGIYRAAVLDSGAEPGAPLPDGEEIAREIAELDPSRP
jgi:hypothetical protein